MEAMPLFACNNPQAFYKILNASLGFKAVETHRDAGEQQVPMSLDVADQQVEVDECFYIEVDEGLWTRFRSSETTIDRLVCTGVKIFGEGLQHICACGIAPSALCCCTCGLGGMPLGLEREPVPKQPNMTPEKRVALTVNTVIDAELVRKYHDAEHDVSGAERGRSGTGISSARVPGA